MKRKLTAIICAAIAVAALLSTSALAVETSEVESAIAASSREEVAGNIFIWFLCAIAFLKISQKIDSFMASLGINVGRTGGSMLGELLIAGRAIGAAAKATGGAAGNIFNRGYASSTHAAGQTYANGNGGGVIGVAKRAAGNSAAASATGRSSGLSSVLAGAMFNSSLKNGGQFATSTISSIATGNISSTGSITGEKAAEVLSSYLGFGSQDPIAEAAIGDSDLSGGSALGGFSDIGNEAGSQAVPQQPPSFRNVEIGGGRITGYESPASGGSERQFAMYNAGQYMQPNGSYDEIKTVDGESWYRQYAEPTVQKTPYDDGSGKIKYNEQIVEQMPQIPRRKDRV